MKLFGCQPDRLGDATHRVRIDGIMPRDRHGSKSIRHDNMFALSNESPVCSNLDGDESRVAGRGHFLLHFQVFADGHRDVLDRFPFSVPLGNTAG